MKVPISVLLLVNLKFGWNALQGQTGQMDHAGTVPMVVWSITLVAAAVFNFLFMFLLGTRMQRSLARMATHERRLKALDVNYRKSDAKTMK